MAERTFVPWVEPIAAKLRDGRREIVAVAKSTPDDAWSKPSTNEGWTYKDVVAHLATGDWVCQGLLGAATKGTDFVIDSVAEGNARFIDERRETAVADLIAEVEAEGEETQELLSLLTEEHQDLTREGAPMNLGDYLRGFPGHDEHHMAQLKEALEGQA